MTAADRNMAKTNTVTRLQRVTSAARTLLSALAGRAVAVRDLEVIERDVAAPIPGARRDPDLIYRPCTTDDETAFRGIGPQWRALSRHFKARLDRGHMCIGCFDEGRGVGYIWIATGTEIDRTLGLHVRPKRDQVYGFDLFVLPDYRGRAVGYWLVRSWLDHARRLGKRRATGIVLSTNRPMLMLTRTAFGFKSVHRMRAVQLAGRFGVVVRGRQEGLT